MVSFTDIVQRIEPQREALIALIDRFIPGGRILLYMGLLIAFLIFIQKSQGVGHNWRRRLGFVFGLFFFTYLLAGIGWGMIVGLVCILMLLLGRSKASHTRTGSRQEREVARETFGKGFGWIRAVVGAARGAVRRAKTKSAKALAIEEERIAELELHDEAIVASVDKLSKSMENLTNDQVSLQQQEEQIESAIKSMNLNLGKLSTAKGIKETAVRFLRQYAEQLATRLHMLVEIETKKAQKRVGGIQKLEQTIKVIKNATKRANEIGKSAVSVDKRLKKAGSENLNKFRGSVLLKQAKLSELYKSLTSSKIRKDPIAVDAVKAQAALLNKELIPLKRSLAQLDALNSIANKAVRSLQLKLKEIHGVLKSLKQFEKTLSKNEKEMARFQKKFFSGVKRLKDSDSALKAVSVAMAKDKNLLPEAVPTKLTVSSGAVFSQMQQQMKYAIEFNNKTTIPFIESLKPVAAESAQLEAMIRNITLAFKEVVNGFSQLDKVALQATIGGEMPGLGETETSLKQLEGSIAAIMTRTSTKRKSVFARVSKGLPTLKGKITKFTNTLATDLGKTEEVQRTVLNSLTKMLATVLKHKQRAQGQFTKQAAKARNAFATAKKKFKTAA